MTIVDVTNQFVQSIEVSVPKLFWKIDTGLEKKAQLDLLHSQLCQGRGETVIE